MGMVRSSEISVLTTATESHIPEDGILHSHCRENLKSYVLRFILDVTSQALYSVTMN
jgi:hypothetical protein